MNAFFNRIIMFINKSIVESSYGRKVLTTVNRLYANGHKQNKTKNNSQQRKVFHNRSY